MSFNLSNHVKLRLGERGITENLIYDILNNPQQIVDDLSNGPGNGQKVYQSIIEFSDKSTYLVRVFVNTDIEPNVVKTVYRTSDISRYWYYEGDV